MTRIPDAHDPEAGFTLTEVLAALIILGVAIMAIVAAMGSSIIAADTHRKLVSDDAILRSYAEQIQNAAFVECAPAPNGYAPFADLGSWPKFEVRILSVEYWDGNAASTTPAFVSGCTPQSQGAGLQRITLDSNSTTGRGGHQQLQIMKRRS